MSNINLFKTRKIVTTVRENVSLEEFEAALKEHRPSEIWCSEYSKKIPAYVITDYGETGVAVYATGWADKTPQIKSFRELYNSMRYSGLSSSYFKAETFSNAHI